MRKEEEECITPQRSVVVPSLATPLLGTRSVTSDPPNLSPTIYQVFSNQAGGVVTRILNNSWGY